MKAIELEYNKEYKHIGQPSRRLIYTGQQGKKFWFFYKDTEFWMTEKQVETLIEKQ
jgi:hypothetical protein